MKKYIDISTFDINNIQLIDVKLNDLKVRDKISLTYQYPNNEIDNLNLIIKNLTTNDIKINDNYNINIIKDKINKMNINLNNYFKDIQNKYNELLNKYNNEITDNKINNLLTSLTSYKFNNKENIINNIKQELRYELINDIHLLPDKEFQLINYDVFVKDEYIDNITKKELFMYLKDNNLKFNIYSSIKIILDGYNYTNDNINYVFKYQIKVDKIIIKLK